MRRIRVDCDCRAIANPDAGSVDRLARLHLAVQREGGELQLVGAQPCLLELLDLCGLAEVLEARPKGLGERFGDPGGRDSGEAPSSGASASGMRERAAEELNPKIGRMGAEDPPRIFRAGPLVEAGRQAEEREEPGRVQEEGDLPDAAT